MCQEQCDPQIEGKVCNCKVFRQWMRLGREVRMIIPGGITQESGKEEEEVGRPQNIQKELVNLSLSAGRTSAWTLLELKTFVIHYLETTYTVSPLNVQVVLTPVPPEWVRRRQETCSYAK